ncbi:MAG: nickel pincer cofactor biosynthesis protein LarB [Methanomicrobiales archaeon]
MDHHSRLREILLAFQEGSISIDDAEEAVEGLRIEHLHGVARLDLDRDVRCGIPEVVLAEGKGEHHLARILERQVTAAGRCIATRITPAQVEAVSAVLGDGVAIDHREEAGILILSTGPAPKPTGGRVGVLSGGTADIRAAEEAAVIAEEMGCRVSRAYDVGVAGIHRLFPALKEMRDAHVLVVAAGREGTLPAVVAGLVDRPVVGLPVSVGYGFMGEGEAALASMLQACTVLAVVNIDAGFVAGAYAARIAHMVAGR